MAEVTHADTSAVTEVRQPAQRPPRPRRLPVFVGITGFLLALHVGYYILFGVGSLVDLGLFRGLPTPDFVVGETLTAEGSQFVVAVIALVFAGVALAILVGFLLRQRWAWTASMTWGAMSMALNLINFFRGEPNYWSLLINAVFILLLNQATVQATFRRAEPL